MEDTNINSLKNDTKPTVVLSGADGNVYNLIGLVRQALIANGQEDKAKEMVERATASKSYAEVLQMFWDYVDID